MKKYMKVVYILLIVISVFVLCSEVYAVECTVCNGKGYIPGLSSCPACGSDGKIDGLGQIVTGGDEFLEIGTVDEEESPIKKENLKDLSDTIYNILLTVGIIAAFIVGGILGIKYMTSGIEGQAEVKNTLVPYIIGCVVLFGAFTIWKLVVIILQ